MSRIEDISISQALFSLLVGILAVAFIPLISNSGFYYDDDVRHYFIPQVMDVGVRLAQGEIPWISIRSWVSGNYVGEGLLSLSNPVNLALYWLCAQVADPVVAATLFAGSYLLLTALGVYVLARSYNISRAWSVVAALAYCSSGFNLYWWASSWWNALVGFCWMIWAWAGWRIFITRQRAGFVAFLATFFLLVSGWPHGAIMGMLAVLIELISARRNFIHDVEAPTNAGTPAIRVNWTEMSRIFLLAILAVLASLLSNYPALLHARESARAAWGLSGGSSWAGSLDYIIAAGWPSFLGSSAVFFGTEPSMPSFYLAWFAMPALLLLCRRTNWPDGALGIVPLLVVAVIAAVLSLGPQQVFFLRWSLRFLGFAHIALAIAACYALSRLDLQSRPNRTIFLGYVAAGAVVSILVDPEYWPIHITLNGVALLGSILVTSRPPSSLLQPVSAATFVLIIELLVHSLWPRNDNVVHWPVPDTSYPSAPERMLPDNRVVLMRNAYPCEAGRCVLASGNVGMWEEGRTINGYSPTIAKSFQSFLGFDAWSHTNPTSLIPLTLAAYFTADRETGVPRYELMRINEIRTAGPVLSEQLTTVLKGEWSTREISHGTIFSLDGRYSLPGTVSWISPHLTLAEDAEFSSLRERLTITGNGGIPEGGKIVFARAWYPGYSATLDGMPVKVEKHGELLVSVRVPAGTTGTLLLEFRPPGISWTAPLAVASLLLAVLLVSVPRRRSPTP